MTLTVGFDPAALDELQDAHDWYERENHGVGGEFLADLLEVLQNLADWPGLGPRIAVPRASSEFRRASLRRFPYGIVYVVLDDLLVVMAVPHNRRRPGYWCDRLR
ncbi:MAG: type II toxin-antitoxin system RelE/ParE family toxin [Acidimicrobiales bacterium]